MDTDTDTATATATATSPPRVTLITTFRDAARYLPTCIASVQAQTEAGFHHLLVDDGSSDDSVRLAREAAQSDRRVEVVTGPGRGRRDALAAAHAKARTEFVAWVDADDWLEPEALRRTLAVMDAWPECGLVFTDRVRVDSDGCTIRPDRRPLFSRAGMLLDFAAFHFRLIRRQALEAAGGISPAFEIAIDYDLCLRLSEVAPVVHLAEPLYAYRVHPGQMSSTHKKAQREASALAVRTAIGRRGLGDALRFEMRRGRFSVNAQLDRTPKAWHQHARLAARSLLRRRGKAPAEFRTACVWPSGREDLIARSLSDGLHDNGVGVGPLGADLPALVRGAWSGRLGDLLVIQHVARVGASASAGAQRHLLLTALDRARAQGTRIVWCAWADACNPRLDAPTRSGLLRRCDALVVERATELSVEAHRAGVRVVTSPPGSLAELQPVVSRDAARELLGMPQEGRLDVRVGPIEDASALAAQVRAFLQAAPREAHLLVAAPPPAQAVALEMGSQAVDAANVHYALQRWSTRELATAVAAADAVLLDHGPERSALTAVAHARRRFVAVDVGGMVEVLGKTRGELAAVGRSAFADALQVRPVTVAERILAAVRVSEP